MKTKAALLGFTILMASVVAAAAGDYMIYQCGPIKVVWVIPSEMSQKRGHSDAFCEYNGDISAACKELPKKLFRVKSTPDSQTVYYRGKACTEIDED